MRAQVSSRRRGAAMDDALTDEVMDMADMLIARIDRARVDITQDDAEVVAETSTGPVIEAALEPEGRHAMRAPVPRRRARRTREQHRLG